MISVTRTQLRNLIKEELTEGTSGRLSKKQSEIGYSKHKMAQSHSSVRQQQKKDYWKAHRGPGARDSIESQLSSMDSTEADQRTLGDILPIPREEWESYSAVSDGDVPSEKAAYLYDLAYDVAYGREGSDLSQEDKNRIGELVYDQFGFDWLQVLGGYDKPGGHSADAAAEAARDEYYDNITYQDDLSENINMKITRKQLHCIISEELGKLPTKDSPMSDQPLRAPAGPKTGYEIKNPEQAQSEADYLLDKLTVSQHELQKGQVWTDQWDEYDESLLNDLMQKMEIGTYPFYLDFGSRS